MSIRTRYLQKTAEGIAKGLFLKLSSMREEEQYRVVSDALAEVKPENAPDFHKTVCELIPLIREIEEEKGEE